MSVKVGMQQGFVGKHCVTHDTLIDQPVKEEIRGKETESDAINPSGNTQTVCCTYIGCPSGSPGCWAVMWF